MPPPSGLPTYAVVCLHEACCQEAAQYIADRLSAPRGRGGDGAELVVHQEPMRPNGLIIHVSAAEGRLLQLAEEVGVKKVDRDGVVRAFRVDEREEFPPSGDSGCVVGPLTLSDVHRCVLYAMEALHFPRELRHLPGYAKSRVPMRGAPVLSAYREAGHVDTFPLHDDETLHKLHARWKSQSVFSPPVEDIREYFGENVALYVSFSSFYTAFLIPMAALGLVQFALDRFLGISFLMSDVAFACLNLVAVTVFLEMWKRRSAEHEHRWGSGGKLRKKRPRPEFRGEIGVNRITGKEEVQYPVAKTMRKVFFVSLPVTLLCLLVAFFLMLASFQADRFVYGLFVDEETRKFTGGVLGTLATYVPSTLYSVLVLFMNQYYLHLAHHLTEWENHRTQEQFEKFVVAKLVLFEFVNTFLALFYIAFWLKDVTMLRSQVSSMLIVLQIVNQCQESVLPILLRRPSTKRVINKVSKKLVKHSEKHKTTCQHHEVDRVTLLDSEDNRVAMANYSLERDPYESTYDDFMELWLQFGHVFLFSSVYPLAAFFALANNLIELRVDAYKLCKLSRKPTPRCVRDIGAWYAAFSITSIISVMTNCALMHADGSLRATFAATSTDLDWLLLFVVVEHAFLLVRVIIDRLISDVPKSVKDAQDREEFILEERRRRKNKEE